MCSSPPLSSRQGLIQISSLVCSRPCYALHGAVQKMLCTAPSKRGGGREGRSGALACASASSGSLSAKRSKSALSSS